MNLFTAKKLTELRKYNALSQEALAEKIGVSRQAISKWERGDASPDTDNLISLSKIYDVSLDDLLGEKTAEEIIKEKEEKKASSEEAVKAAPVSNGEKAENKAQKKKKKKTKSAPLFPGISKLLFKIPFFLIVIIAYLVIGFLLNKWHPTWIMFLTIPAYYLTAIAFRASTKKGFLLSLPIYMYVIIFYISVGITLSLWHPTWIAFLLIPAYYWAVSMMKK